MNSDNELQMKVTQELLWDPAVESMHAVVGAKNGIVTLTGYVQHFGKKQAAQQAAERIAGVVAVANELDIKLPSSSERNFLDIAESALNALRLNTQVLRDAIKVAVENAWVTLEGSVDWHCQGGAAEHAVKNLPGIKGMINKIEIKPAALTNGIQEKIRNAFSHRGLEPSLRSGSASSRGTKPLFLLFSKKLYHDRHYRFRSLDRPFQRRRQTAFQGSHAVQ